MKLLLVSNVFPPHVIGGYELGCLMNAEAFRRAGHEVRIVTSMSFGCLEKKAFRHDLDVRQIFAPVYDYEFGDRSYQRSPDFSAAGGVHPGNALALAEAIDAWRPDAIVIFNPLGIGPVGILETAVASGVPTVVHLMDALDKGVMLSQHGFEVGGRWAAAKRRASAIACSWRMLDANSRLGRYRAATVIPSGIDTAAFPQPPRPRAWSATEPVRMVYFGQIKSHKGVHHVVTALGVLRRRMRLDVELHLIGGCDRTFAAELRSLAAADGCVEAVHWHGQRDRHEVQALLETMHLAVLPLNADEAFGYVAPEAALHGMCVAVGRQAGCAEVFPQGYPYFLEDREDPAAIAETVRRIIVDPETRQHWEEVLPGHIAARCDLDGVCVPRYLDVIQGAIDGAADAPPVPDHLPRTLAAWQMNRNVGRLLGDHGPAPEDKSKRLGRRLERVIRRTMPAKLRYRIKGLLRVARGQAA
jgi:glycosyltransferase involved in cell wall biosynthesis